MVYVMGCGDPTKCCPSYHLLLNCKGELVVCGWQASWQRRKVMTVEVIRLCGYVDLPCLNLILSGSCDTNTVRRWISKHVWNSTDPTLLSKAWRLTSFFFICSEVVGQFPFHAIKKSRSNLTEMTSYAKLQVPPTPSFLGRKRDRQTDR